MLKDKPTKADYLLSFYILFKNYPQILKIVSILSDREQQDSAAKRHIYLMVGFSKSGKTTLCTTDPTLRHLPRLGTNHIHALLKTYIPETRDDNTVTGQKYWIRQILTKATLGISFLDLVRRRKSFIVDSCHLFKKFRALIIRVARLAHYQVTIYHVTCHEDELIRRLNEADSKEIAEGRDPTWMKLYIEVQKPHFEPPTPTEADALIEITTSPAYKKS